MDELIQELKAQGVLKSQEVEAAFCAIDRKDFVRPEYAHEAYGNYPLPIGAGQTISQPYTVAFMLDQLDPKAGERVLDVGAGSGWQTALLAHIVSGIQGQRTKDKRRKTKDERQEQKDEGPRPNNKGRVIAVERIPELCEFAKSNIEKYGFITNGIVEFFCEDATAAIPGGGTFDKIIAAASAYGEIPDIWRKALKISGKIVAPVGNSLWCFTKKPEGKWQEHEYPGFAFVPLIVEKNELEKNNTSEEKRNENASRPFSGKRNFMFFFLAACFLLLGYSAYALFVPLRTPKTPTAITIARGSGSRAISNDLARNGLIRSRILFLTYAALIGKSGALKPGEYSFGPTVTLPQIVNTLAKGDSGELAITIPEGWDLRVIGAYLENLDLFTKETFWNIAGEPAQGNNAYPQGPPLDFSKEFAFLKDKPKDASLEGYLYPDTYRIYRRATPQEVIEKMLENFDRRVDPALRDEIRRQGKSLFQVLTMASLLETEVKSSAERRIVSGILWKRLNAGIPLQVDSSVNYATGNRRTPTAKDLANTSPYNTYRFSGLPAGPIANPSLDAIRAALEPKSSPYLFYLSSPDGTTVFSRTAEEHAAAKARYLRP